MLRVVGAVVGGYALSAAMVALGAVVLTQIFDWRRSEAVLLTSMLGFICYLVLLLWAFSAPRTGRMLAVILGATAAIYLLLRILAPSTP